LHLRASAGEHPRGAVQMGESDLLDCTILRLYS